MRLMRTLLLLCLAPAFYTAPAMAAVRVTFANAAHYTDPNIRDTPMLGAIRAHLQQLGARYLDRNAQLNITVLDIDLAGFDLSSRGPSRPRVFNGTTSPKITLRYQLERNGRIVTFGEDYLTDQFYLIRPGTSTSSDELKYEKALLDGWFREKFAAGRTSAR